MLIEMITSVMIKVPYSALNHFRIEPFGVILAPTATDPPDPFSSWYFLRDSRGAFVGVKIREYYCE
jgi:hypothetical protein